MATASSEVFSNTAGVNASIERIDALKEQLRSTPQELDFERVRIMREVYGKTEGLQQILRRAQFLADVLDRKKLYIDDNLFVGHHGRQRTWPSITNPEWNVELDEGGEDRRASRRPPKTREANAWALDYWEQAGAEAPHRVDL